MRLIEHTFIASRSHDWGFVCGFNFEAVAFASRAHVFQSYLSYMRGSL